MANPRTSKRRPLWCRNMPDATKLPLRPSSWLGFSNTRQKFSPCWELRVLIGCGPVPRPFPFLYAATNGTLFSPRPGEHPCLENTEQLYAITNGAVEIVLTSPRL